MRQRSFTFAVVLLGLVALVTPSSMTSLMNILGNLSKRIFSRLGFLANESTTMSSQQPVGLESIPSLLTMSIDDLTTGLGAGHFTVSDVTRTSLARIQEVNDKLHAVIQVNPAALKIASSLDDLAKTSKPRGPLFGVPVLVKDNIVTNEDMEATSGSLVLLDSRPSRESSVVTRLRQAGAVILGSANLSEWANFRSKLSITGWSPRGNLTVGSYYDKMSSSGSSGGSAVAVDVALCFAALGTETWGSLIGPGHYNNVVGIKPTVGLVSRDSTIPVSYAKDTIGPLARTVRDAAAILSVIAGRDENDPATKNIPFEEIPDYTESCHSTDLSGVKLGIPTNAMFDVPKHILDHFQEVVGKLRAQGAEIVDIEFPAVEAWRSLEFKEMLWAMATEFRTSIRTYFNSLEQNPHNLRTLEDLIQLMKSEPAEDCQNRDLGLWELALETDPDGTEYKEAKERERYFSKEGGIIGAIEKHSLDAIIVPSTADIPNAFAAGGGLPMLTVPMGYLPENTPLKWSDRKDAVVEAPNRPYGFGVLGKAFTEQSLIKIAFVVETITETRKEAKHHILPTTDLKDVLRTKALM